jgi:hypothetical protein
MPELRNPNDSELSQYLYCNKKNNKPRIHHTVCEERCKKFKKCPYYGEWYREYYDKEVEEKPKPKPKIKKVVKRTRKKIKKRKPKAKAVSA